MKLNEPVRAGGIGRKQIAWNTDKNISEQSILEEAANDPASTSAHSPVSTLAETMKLARVAAYSAASSAVANNENRIWSTQSIQSWRHYSSNFGPSQSYVKWQADPDDLSNVRTGLAYVDAEDPTIIRVTKKGWYLVNAHFFQGDHSLNNMVNELTIVAADSADTATAKSVFYSHGYPSISISSVNAVPGYDYQGEAYSPRNDMSDGGFKLVYTIGAHNQDLDITPINSYAYIQIVWLMPWESDLFYNGA
jgi:hypothetical protein